MRVALLNQFYTPDLAPTAHLASSLAEHRASRGDDVTVVTSLGGYVAASSAVRDDRKDTPLIYRIWTPRAGKATVLHRCIDYGTFYMLAALRMLRLPRQDVIVSLTTPPYIIWTAILHRLLHPKTKLVLWNMDCYPELAERSNKLKTNGLASRTMRMLNRAMFRRIDYLISLDTAMQELLCSQYAAPNNPITACVIPNWEPAAMFPSSAEHPRWSETKELGLDERFVVLYLGNAGFGHCFETVVEAAKLLRNDPVVFLFVGGGTRYDDLAASKEAHKLDNLILHDYVPKEVTPSVMQAADCALITLRDEILGVMSPSKLHANLAAGLPILYVGPKTSNVDDAIERFGCGVSVRHGDAQSIVAFIRELMCNRQEKQDLRDRARRAFDEAYCDTRALSQFDAIFEQLAREPAVDSMQSVTLQADT